MGSPRIQLMDMPPEVLSLVISQTPLQTRFQLRLISKACYRLATPEAFRHIRLIGNGAKRFKRIAITPHLQRHVREITCDGGDAAAWERNGEATDTDNPLSAFLAALPFIRRFSGLRILNLAFHRTHDIDNSFLEPVALDCYFFRQWVMLAAFHSVLGKRVIEDVNWNPDRYDGRHGLLRALIVGNGITLPKDWHFLREESSTINLEQLNITNLAGTTFHDYKETETNDCPFWKRPAVKQITSLPSLKSLSLMITPDNMRTQFRDEVTESSTFESPNEFRYITKCLPQWFDSSAACNLTVLSLYYDELWGYYPKFDFRLINPGNGSDSGFPHLGVLSLTRYCFSHEWQIEWVASLGRNGLRELYLDECALLSVAFCSTGPERADENSYAQSIDGNAIAFSNQGYLPGSWKGGHSWDPWAVYYDSNLKWSQFFDYWRVSMSSLKVFRMGSTEAHTTWSHVKMTDYWGRPLPRTAVPDGYFFDKIKTEAHTRFHDDSWRKSVRMEELKVPFYVKFMPEPIDGHNRNILPWIFLPARQPPLTGKIPEAFNDDITALEMLRETVDARSRGVI
ncbi:F-box domain protein [Colletotrichum karsti]|uniref:F-box domain protein n=1 Tax=Colletotrichum karsti TaxID=1095194 RepID=A0A9P6LLH6_9PEZI|nr:F-box domain protein [Colletotrichum karsti]KAF9880439.1 F-box domain protein [Colletotrichum karsti]